jgi:hypothetical protein
MLLVFACLAVHIGGAGFWNIQYLSLMQSASYLIGVWLDSETVLAA